MQRSIAFAASATVEPASLIEPASAGARAARRHVGLAAAAIVCVGALAYVNSFAGRFIFDDRSILEDASIRHLWPPWMAMFSPNNVARPIIGLTFAINYAISGLEVWSYHLINLLIHLLAALALFGVVRRALLSERMRERFGAAATALAASVALVWAVHPLQTQSVTYIIQRGESLMGLMYLATLYAVIRAAQSVSKRWVVAAVTACAMGMATKPVMATAPIIALLFDVIFITSSLTSSLRRRRALYAALGSTWIILAATITAPTPADWSAGFRMKQLTPVEYLQTQFGVIAHYLRLAVWPDALVLDYGWPVARTASEIIPFAAIIISLAAATLWALARRPAVGFLGAWFFLILAPTSSVMPIADLAFEHRMYLPLAAIVALCIIGSYRTGQALVARLARSPARRKQLGQFVGAGLLAVIVAALGSLTFLRNTYYQSDIVMWADVVKKRPGNARAHNNLGMFLAERGQYGEALAHFDEACRLNPNDALAKNNLALTLANQGRVSEAIPLYLDALQRKPDYTDAHFNLGRALTAQGDLEAAKAHFSATTELDPTYGEAYFGLAMVLEKQGRAAAAVEPLRRVVELRPDWVDALDELALILATHAESQVRDAGRAVELAERAVRLTRAERAAPLDALAAAYAEAQRFEEAVKTAQQAAALASAAGDTRLANDIKARLVDYQARRPRRETPTIANQPAVER
jgi:tetratricopeptide (TPR) repeat protein